MEFGARLKELRTRLNISQKELSEQTGLTLRTIQRIENNEVKPSLYSVKVLGEVLQADLSPCVKPSEAKPYEINLMLKITDMNQFLHDLTVLFKTHWKTIFLIVLVIWLLTSYTDIISPPKTYSHLTNAQTHQTIYCSFCSDCLGQSRAHRFGINEIPRVCPL